MCSSSNSEQVSSFFGCNTVYFNRSRRFSGNILGISDGNKHLARGRGKSKSWKKHRAASHVSHLCPTWRHLPTQSQQKEECGPFWLHCLQWKGSEANFIIFVHFQKPSFRTTSPKEAGKVVSFGRFCRNCSKSLCQKTVSHSKIWIKPERYA